MTLRVKNTLRANAKEPILEVNESSNTPPLYREQWGEGLASWQKYLANSVVTLLFIIIFVKISSNYLHKLTTYM